MKKIIVLLLVLSSMSVHAQDWKSVRMNDTTYYTIPAANDYLRVIWIDSATTAGTDSIFHFYPSIRLGNTTTNCLDTLGPTWLGKSFTKKANGDELYFNRWLDSIILKPKSSLNSTWVMYTDTANNEYRATISSLDTMTIDNQLDSIKEVTIQVFINNIIDTTHFHHNKKMLLSKKHGFVDCLEWYGFPDIPSSGSEPFKTFQNIHTRFTNNGYVLTDDSDIDLLWKYQTGNVWQYEKVQKRFISTTSWNQLLVIEEDSVANVQVVTPDSLIVTIYSMTMTKWGKQGFPDSITVTNNIDTFSITNNSQIMAPILPESYPALIDYHAEIICHRPNMKKVNNGCAYLNITTPCPNISPPVSACVIRTNTFWKGFGNTEISFFFPGTIAGAFPPYDTYLKYARIDNCEFGGRLPIWPLSLRSFKLNNSIKIYPNPSYHKINFETSDNSIIISAKLFSMTGKQITTCQNCNHLKTATITNGFYILYIETENGILRKKILIQH